MGAVDEDKAKETSSGSAVDNTNLTMDIRPTPLSLSITSNIEPPTLASEECSNVCTTESIKQTLSPGRVDVWLPDTDALQYSTNGMHLDTSNTEVISQKIQLSTCTKETQSTTNDSPKITITKSHATDTVDQDCLNRNTEVFTPNLVSSTLNEPSGNLSRSCNVDMETDRDMSEAPVSTSITTKYPVNMEVDSSTSDSSLIPTISSTSKINSTPTTTNLTTTTTIMDVHPVSQLDSQPSTQDNPSPHHGLPADLTSLSPSSIVNEADKDPDAVLSPSKSDSVETNSQNSSLLLLAGYGDSDNEDSSMAEEAVVDSSMMNSSMAEEAVDESSNTSEASDKPQPASTVMPEEDHVLETCQEAPKDLASLNRNSNSITMLDTQHNQSSTHQSEEMLLEKSQSSDLSTDMVNGQITNQSDDVPVIVQTTPSRAVEEPQESLGFYMDKKGGYRYMVTIGSGTDDSESSSEATSSSESESSSSSESEESATDEPNEQKSPRPKLMNKKQRKDQHLTPGELTLAELPAIEDLHISVPEEKANPIGSVYKIVTEQVVVEGLPNVPAIDIDSVLFLERGGRALGRVFDIFGPVEEPFYVVRFNSHDHVTQSGVQLGNSVFYAPYTDYTTFIILSQLMRLRGSDASGQTDNERVEEEDQDFSDDDEEAKAQCGSKGSRHTSSTDDFQPQRKRSCGQNGRRSNDNQCGRHNPFQGAVQGRGGAGQGRGRAGQGRGGAGQGRGWAGWSRENIPQFARYNFNLQQSQLPPCSPLPPNCPPFPPPPCSPLPPPNSSLPPSRGPFSCPPQPNPPMPHRSIWCQQSSALQFGGPPQLPSSGHRFPNPSLHPPFPPPPGTFSHRDNPFGMKEGGRGEMISCPPVPPSYPPSMPPHGMPFASAPPRNVPPHMPPHNFPPCPPHASLFFPPSQQFGFDPNSLPPPPHKY